LRLRLGGRDEGGAETRRDVIQHGAAWIFVVAIGFGFDAGSNAGYRFSQAFVFLAHGLLGGAGGGEVCAQTVQIMRLLLNRLLFLVTRLTQFAYVLLAIGFVGALFLEVGEGGVTFALGDFHALATLPCASFGGFPLASLNLEITAKRSHLGKVGTV